MFQSTFSALMKSFMICLATTWIMLSGFGCQGGYVNTALAGQKLREYTDAVNECKAGTNPRLYYAWSGESIIGYQKIGFASNPAGMAVSYAPMFAKIKKQQKFKKEKQKLETLIKKSARLEKQIANKKGATDSRTLTAIANWQTKLEELKPEIAAQRVKSKAEQTSLVRYIKENFIVTGMFTCEVANSDHETHAGEKCMDYCFSLVIRSGEYFNVMPPNIPRWFRGPTEIYRTANGWKIEDLKNAFQDKCGYRCTMCEPVGVYNMDCKQ